MTLDTDWLRAIQCADCGTPLEVDTTACPYCYSTRPHGDNCPMDGLGESWWAFTLAILGLGMLLVMVVSDIWFDTQLLPTLLETVSGWLD